VTESVEAWWKRRQWSKGTELPYAVGQFRADWERYPILIRQYHPDLNHGITLTQVPPAADVLLLWVCDVGHHFVATPDEQRHRPGGTRRRSSWCPDCAALAAPRPVVAPTTTSELPRLTCGHVRDPRRIENDEADDRCYLCRRLDASPVTREMLLAIVAPGQSTRLSEETSVTARYSWQCPRGHGRYDSRLEQMLQGKGCPTCRHARGGADRVEPGEAFASPWAPKPASAAEASLRQLLGQRLEVDLGLNAVRVAQPFFSHLEVWPDIPVPELRVAVEYDTTGRDGLEHVGRREQSDRRKDRLLRSVGWEVVRIRCGKLQPLGPWDIVAAGVSAQLIDRLVDRFEEIRGALIVRSYLR
jgi:Probable Zinc-ribbon domain